jgi:hypothetical protein
MKRIFTIMLIAFISCNIKSQTGPANCPEKKTTMTTEQYNNFINEKCEVGNEINTNPNNLKNDDCPDLKNDFEWRLKHSPNLPFPPNEFYVAYDANGVPKGLRNPFNDDDNNNEYSYLSGNHGSNYHPEDGWELLKVDFGALSNFNTGYSVLDLPGINPEIGGKRLPYMILYNKYTGTFRFFGSLLGQLDGYQTIRIELRIPKTSPNQINVYQPDLKATNLLSIQGDAVQPLDQETEENVMVVFARATNNENNFFWFDIPVAYDPCLCNIRSQLDISFTFVQTADIKLNGKIEAGIKTEKKADNTPYGLKVATRVIAAGVGAVLAVKTGGTVVNFKAFTDLVHLIKENPNANLSQVQKDNLTELQGYLDCGAKFAQSIHKGFPDINDTDKKKRIKAANEILDANTTFLSSLATGCSKQDNGATTISGALNISGTWTEESIVGQTEVKLAMPGSNWSDKNMAIINGRINGLTIPASPTYNERLGTFALLETPKFKINNTYSYQAFEDVRNYNSLIFQQNSDFKITFNPLLNLNFNKTKILARIVIDTNYVSWPSNFTKYWDVNNPNETYISPFNLVKNDGSQYSYTSSFVDYEYLKNMSFRIDIGSGQNIISKFEKRIFVQFKIIGESNNIGFDGNKINFYQIMNFPIIFDEIQNVSNVILKDGNINQIIKEYDNDIQFSKTENIIFEGPVFISAKMSTSNGAKIKIYSMNGFELEPGAEISPDIELIVGFPWDKIPQPPQTYAEVSSFCNNNNKYKAQTFSQSAIKREKEEYEARQIRDEEAIKQKSIISFKLAPNPTTANFTVSIFNNNEQDYNIALMDVTGKVLLNNLYNGKQTSQFIETNGLAAGIYFVKITCGNTQKTEKLIIHNNQ